MLSSVPLIVAAASVRIAIPSFELDNAPRLLAQRLPEYYAAAIDAAQCASSVAASGVSAEAADAIGACQGSAPCISGVGDLLAVDFVLIGHLTRAAGGFETHLDLVDVEKHATITQLDSHYGGALKDIGTSVRQSVPQLCRAMDPGWIDPSKKKKAEASLEDLSFDTDGLAASKPAAPPPAPPPPPPLEPPPELAAASTAPAIPPPPAIPASPATVETSAEKPTVIASLSKPEPQTSIPPAAVAPPARLAALPVPPRVELAAPHPAAEPRSGKLLGFIPAPASSRARSISFGLFLTTGAAAIVGGGTGAGALASAKARLAATDLPTYYSSQSNAVTRATVSNVSFGLAGVAGITSLIIWFAGDRLFHDNTVMRQATLQ